LRNSIALSAAAGGARLEHRCRLTDFGADGKTTAVVDGRSLG
jgi:hypothetical protein